MPKLKYLPLSISLILLLSQNLQLSVCANNFQTYTGMHNIPATAGHGTCWNNTMNPAASTPTHVFHHHHHMLNSPANSVQSGNTSSAAQSTSTQGATTRINPVTNMMPINTNTNASGANQLTQPHLHHHFWSHGQNSMPTNTNSNASSINQPTAIQHHHMHHNFWSQNSLQNNATNNNSLTNQSTIASYHQAPWTHTPHFAPNTALVHSSSFNSMSVIPHQFSHTSTALDLNSTANTIAAPNHQAITIVTGGNLTASGTIEGGTSVTISPGQMITASQYVAVVQVMHSGHQTLLLGSQGNADGGYFVLTPVSSRNLTALDIPKAVSLDAVGFSAARPLVVNGQVNISGSLYALEFRPNTTAVLDLNSANISSGGLLSTSAPSSLGFSSNFLSASGLTLNLTNSLINSGSISTPGTLVINAGGNITNQSIGSSVATITGSSVNLSTGAGNLTNSGLIAASNGNLNINTAAMQNLNVNNQNGILQAANGNINFRDASYTGSNNVSLTGGNSTAKNINFYSGNGDVSVNVDSLNGMANVSAGTAHFQTANNVLSLGNFTLTGDPTFYNTGGAVNVNGAINTSGADVAFVANTDVIFQPGSSVSTSGGAITAIAGVDFTSTGPGSGSNDTTSTLTISGASLTGGRVDLTGATSLSSSNAAGNGGNILLAAFGGVGANSGTITAPSSMTITSGGSGAGANGNVTVLASAPSGTAINIGNINTTGGSGGGRKRYRYSQFIIRIAGRYANFKWHCSFW